MGNIVALVEGQSSSCCHVAYVAPLNLKTKKHSRSSWEIFKHVPMFPFTLHFFLPLALPSPIYH